MSATRGHPFWWLGIAFVLIALFIVAPFLSLFIGGGIADALGCTLPISSTAPCLLMGVDLADTLALMVFIGYLGFVTVPLATTLFTIWLVIACIVTFIWWWRRRREA
jgi:hypothetical protein